MTGLSRGVAPAAIVVLAVLAAGEVSADQPTDHLRRQIDRVVTTLGDPALRAEDRAAERRAAMRRIADDIFDFEETARRSLATHWPRRTPAERREFVQLFAALLERSYISRLDTYGGEQIGYLGDTVDGDQAIVRTRIVTRQGSHLPIDYRMRRHADRWLVYDVIIEGVSLVANYRSQFDRIIRSSSYEELVRKLKDKQDEVHGADQPRRTSRN